MWLLTLISNNNNNNNRWLGAACWLLIITQIESKLCLLSALVPELEERKRNDEQEIPEKAVLLWNEYSYLNYPTLQVGRFWWRETHNCSRYGKYNYYNCVYSYNFMAADSFVVGTREQDEYNILRFGLVIIIFNNINCAVSGIIN